MERNILIFIIFFAFRTNRWYEVVSFHVGSFLSFSGKFDVKKVVTNMRTLLKTNRGSSKNFFIFSLVKRSSRYSWGNLEPLWHTIMISATRLLLSQNNWLIYPIVIYIQALQIIFLMMVISFSNLFDKYMTIDGILSSRNNEECWKQNCKCFMVRKSFVIFYA